MSKPLKSAWELALEKVGGASDAAVDPETKARIAEARQRFLAKRAEMQILHAADLRALPSKVAPAESMVRRAEMEETYRRDLRKLQEEEEAEITRLRGSR